MRSNNFFMLLFQKFLAFILVLSIISFTSGCCTMFGDKSQNVTVKTVPAGKFVRYQGNIVRDGNIMYVKKGFKAPQFHLEYKEGFQFIDLEYNPDVWLIGDGLLLLLGVVPGLIGFGVDIVTGDWRDFDNPQVIYFPEQN